QNAIAQARLDQIPSVHYTHFLADLVVKQLIQGKWGNDASSDHRRVVQMHEASASALYNVTGRIVSEKVIHLQASTLGEIIAEVPSHVSVNQTSLLATQGHNCAWMTPHSLSA
ncbi:MAG: hypothetical protein NTU97_00870, partial [Candidatus Magasanikbacteria bacterium]|nr:hypothetical protein [Candidatus Magasanikbacteria bacterium]